jgi:hypothetical protein
LAPAERECLDLAAALAARFALHYADTCGPSGRHKPVFLETVTLRRAELAAQIEDCERRYPRPAPPPPVVVPPPAAPQLAPAVPARAAPAISTAGSASAVATARTATPLVAAASAASWSAADNDDDSSVTSSSVADDSYLYSDDDDSYSSGSCGGWQSSINIDGTPMIPGSCIDFHGHAYGAINWDSLI